MQDPTVYKIDVEVSVREMVNAVLSKQIKQFLELLIREKHRKENLGQKRDSKGRPIIVDEVEFNERKAIGAKYVDLKSYSKDFWNEFSEASESTELTEFLETINVYNTNRTLRNFCLLLMELGDIQYCLFTLETLHSDSQSFRKARKNINNAINEAMSLFRQPNGLNVNIWMLGVLMTTTKHYVRQQIAQNRDAVIQGFRVFIGSQSDWDQSMKPDLDNAIKQYKGDNPIKDKSLEQAICLEVLKTYFKELQIDFPES